MPISVAISGSSPHTRGARRPRAGRPPDCRIIPAYAGSTGRARSRPWTVADHPRIRGEHPLDVQAGLTVGGSSPHTRGARVRHRRHLRRGGIIPAYAGSTSGRRRCGPPTWDHPRIRGEHSNVLTEVCTDFGSSPHTRGAPGRRLALVLGVGIIPAYAGSTASSHFADSTCWDHPRIRGEHDHGDLVAGVDLGSSPHTRGARGLCGPPDRGSGIIPAYAGSTLRPSTSM